MLATSQQSIEMRMALANAEKRSGQYAAQLKSQLISENILPENAANVIICRWIGVGRIAKSFWYVLFVQAFCVMQPISDI